MSLYLPPTVTSAQLDILREPYFGGEWNIYFSHLAAKRIGGIVMSAPAVGVYTDDPATALTAVTGEDIQVVCVSPLSSTVNTVITLACLDNTVTPISMNGVATFAPPGWVNDQSKNFEVGYATDLIPAVGGKKYTSVVSLTSIVGGSANCAFDLYTLPVFPTDYFVSGCRGAMSFNDRSPTVKGVDCGMVTDAFIKAGKTQPAELNIEFKLRSLADGLPRVLGRKLTVLAVGIKSNQVTADQIVFTGFRPSGNFDHPDGDEPSMVRCAGKYETMLMFSAPY
jgi:hypothetical protein